MTSPSTGNPNYWFNERTGEGGVNQPSGQVTLKFHFEEILKILDQELPASVDQKTLETIANRFETYMLENHMQVVIDQIHDRVIRLDDKSLPPPPDDHWGE